MTVKPNPPHWSNKRVRDEIGIKDTGPKPTKISLLTRLKRINDRIDGIVDGQIVDNTNLINAKDKRLRLSIIFVEDKITEIFEELHDIKSQLRDMGCANECSNSRKIETTSKLDSAFDNQSKTKFEEFPTEP